MKLSYEAQDLLATTLAKRGARFDTDELNVVLTTAGMLATKREESSVSKSAMADAMGLNHLLDSHTLGARDGRNWAMEARDTQPSMFTHDCFLAIWTGLGQTDLKGDYLKGWRDGIGSVVRDFRNGTVR